MEEVGIIVVDIAKNVFQRQGAADESVIDRSRRDANYKIM